MNTAAPNNRRDARLRRPERFQVEMHFHSLDQMLPGDHRARIVWSYVESLDLSALYAKIRVAADVPGRAAADPALLVALWLLATLDGIGSARELARRCTSDIPYLWLCGGVSVNYHSLSDFRVEHAEFLETLLIDTVASLIDRGLVPLETVAQDGMRVRANAGSSSFRRRPTLERLQQEASAHLERLKEESEQEGARQQGDARRKAARERAARDRQNRIEEALQQREQLSQQREKRKKGDGETTRCSTTDPDARKMKMANGGYDPAFNVQFATDGDARIIVGVEVTNEGTDSGQMPPMHEQLKTNYGKTPKQYLVDSAFATKQAVTQLEEAKTKVVAGIPRAGQIEQLGGDPHQPRPGDSEAYQAFRTRMSEDHYKELYKSRPSIAEFPNAVCRNQGLRQFPVRGLAKAKAIALWHALAFNFGRMLNLGAIG